uniref:Uncharacterized protein n=1 Tax=Glossina austeni TaxID=7395 RepID=A0A1A9VW79_GLOAU
MIDINNGNGVVVQSEAVFILFSSIKIFCDTYTSSFMVKNSGGSSWNKKSRQTGDWVDEANVGKEPLRPEVDTAITGQRRTESWPIEDRGAETIEQTNDHENRSTFVLFCINE